jgi:fermentation-respiration switch protein FrsA (DUF1100 family)
MKSNTQNVLKIGAASLAMMSAITASAQEGWDKKFPKSDKVDHQKVTFKNRYGITLVADLYQPKNRGSHRLAGLAVGGPFGAIKEQSSGLYAQTMAERGFVTIAFDPSYTGESGGQPRNLASPDINTEDFSAAVDFLGLRSSVDRERRERRNPWTSSKGLCQARRGCHRHQGLGTNEARPERRRALAESDSERD